MKNRPTSVIAFFSAKKYDRTFFDQAWALYHNSDAAIQDGAPSLEIRYIENRLEPRTMELAKGIPVICAFVNDHLDANVIGYLAENGLRVIAMRCAGYNNVDINAAHARNVEVVRVPAYSPYAVAEHAVSLFLCLNRKLHKAYNRIRDDNFSLEGLVGHDIHGMTVGVIGTGKIGECFARIMHGFGVRLLACDVRQNPNLLDLGVEYVNPLPEMMKQCDVVSLHCPLFESTYHMINTETIAAMKQGCILINTSRGGLVCTNALIKGIKSGQLGGAGIDVYENEAELFYSDWSSTGIDDDSLKILRSYPNVLITSHQGFLTDKALETIAQVTLENIVQTLHGKPCSNVVEA